MVKIEEYKNNVDPTPLLSVCVQTFNHEKFIAQCLDSILMQQTNFDYEVLLGEDDSSDDTRKICLEYAEKYPDKIRLFLHSRENVIYINGSPTGRFNINHNLKNAKGKYIALCEGDDYWTDPKKLQKQVDFLEVNPDYVGCYAGCMHVDENNQVIKESRFSEYRSPSSDKLMTAEGAMITNSVVFRNVVKEYPPSFMNVPSGDTILYHLMGFHGHGKFLPDIKYSAYRIHSGGIWSGINTIKRLENTFLTMAAVRNSLVTHFGKQSEYVKRMDQTTFNNINIYLYQSLQKKNFSIYFKMIRKILKQNNFSKMFLLKEHLIDLFKRLFKLYQ